MDAKTCGKWFFLGYFFILLFSPLGLAHYQQPKLIIQLTIDQLRGDLLNRYKPYLQAGGIQFFLENGVIYQNAHHSQANTETTVGHVNLATGSIPSHHGMIANYWFDQDTHQRLYAFEDPLFPILKSKEVALQSEFEKINDDFGRSPRNILSSTFADELAFSSFGQAKVFSVSGKDRAAIALGGHSGKALWYSEDNGQFVTSHYYYDQYPAWVDEWNKQKNTNKFDNQEWTLQKAEQFYPKGLENKSNFKNHAIDLGRKFPHALGPSADPNFYRKIKYTPALDELTFEFAKQTILKESLGQNSTTDFLHVGLSSTDYVGHLFGPSSLEATDNLVTLDKNIAEFLKFIDEHIGINNTLFILTADHGTPELPSFVKRFGPAVGMIKLEDIRQATLNALSRHYAKPEELFIAYEQPYIYLRDEKIQQHKLDKAQIEQDIVIELKKIRGIYDAISTQALIENKYVSNRVIKQVLRNHHPKRSGHVYLVWEQHWSIEGEEHAITHGSPWGYDSHVPLIIAGLGLSKKSISRQVTTSDLAPTLSALLGIRYPSAASNILLDEVLVSLKVPA